MKDFIMYLIIGIGLVACASQKVSRQIAQVDSGDDRRCVGTYEGEHLLFVRCE